MSAKEHFNDANKYWTDRELAERIQKFHCKILKDVIIKKILKIDPVRIFPLKHF